MAAGPKSHRMAGKPLAPAARNNVKQKSNPDSDARCSFHITDHSTLMLRDED